MNLILGSGITGLLAKKILGDNWTIIPFRQSRYFSFEIPWADNFIRCDPEIDDFMRGLWSDDAPILLYKSPFSYQGQLINDEISSVTTMYLDKVYGDQVPAVAESLIKTCFAVYPITVKELHDALQRKYLGEIKENVSKYGMIKSIDVVERVVEFENNRKLSYDKIISTIPLNTLCGFCGLNLLLDSKPIIFYHIVSDAVDLEGARQAYVCDKEIDFYKVGMLREHNYIFWCSEIVVDAYKFFGSILNYRLNIMESIRIAEAMPVGDAPDLNMLDKVGIHCVGSNAQWDDFMDVASCIKRLFKLK